MLNHINNKSMKKTNLIYKASILLLLCGLLCACDIPIGEIRIDQESKDYCLFAEGSYWIFQDSATYAIDSVVIDKPVYYDFSRSSVNAYNCESYSTRISSYSQDNIASRQVVLTTGEANSDLEKTCVLEVTTFGTMYHNGEIFEIVSNNHCVILVEKKANYSINGTTYFQVKIFEDNCRGEEKRIFYWAKHVGLIRTEIYNMYNNDTVIVKNLIRYNVKQ